MYFELYALSSNSGAILEPFGTHQVLTRYDRLTPEELSFAYTCTRQKLSPKSLPRTHKAQKQSIKGYPRAHVQGSEAVPPKPFTRILVARETIPKKVSRAHIQGTL